VKGGSVSRRKALGERKGLKSLLQETKAKVSIFESLLRLFRKPTRRKGGLIDEPFAVKKAIANIFAKSDPLLLTHFPHNWERDHFVPLTRDERKYMKTEILRWYKIFTEVRFPQIAESVKKGTLRLSKSNKALLEFQEKYPEEASLVSQEIIRGNLPILIETRMESLSEDRLLSWKPVKGDACWEPPPTEWLPILETLSSMSKKEIEKEFDKQKKELEGRRALQGRLSSDQERVDAVLGSLEKFLNARKKEIIRNTYNRLLLEWASFPFYYGKVEKTFKNELYETYRSQCDEKTFNQMFAKTYLRLTKFISIYGKEEILIWLDEQWPEYLLFMKNHYKEKSQKELLSLDNKPNNVYTFAVDFYALILLKVSIENKSAL